MNLNTGSRLFLRSAPVCLSGLAACMLHLPRADEGFFRCETDADCINGYLCRDGFCASRTAPGDEGVADIDGGDRFTGGDGCVPDCASLQCGPDPVCGVSCGRCENPAAGACSPAGVCVPCQPSQACDDGSLCTYGDTCTETGLCVGVGITCADDPGPCGKKRHCDGTAVCVETQLPVGASCNDGNLCTHTDKCNETHVCVGTAITCNDDSETCGRRRTCNGTATCTVTLPGANVGCDDQELCTYDDHCNGEGGCVGTTVTCPQDDPGPCGKRWVCNGTSSCSESFPGAETFCQGFATCTTCNGAGGCGGGVVVYCAGGICEDCTCSAGPSCDCSIRGNCGPDGWLNCGSCSGCGSASCCYKYHCNDCQGACPSKTDELICDSC